MSLQVQIFEILFKVVNNILDKNWDGILDACAREAIAEGYSADTITNTQLSEVMAGKIKETNFLRKKEDNFYLFCLDNMNVDWADRIKKRMAETGNAVEAV
ncbi:hypothetical protein [Thalassolituus sp.]|jgi:hypothetical protein|uniref:hypothetical protein n=1 Tax=Thalassolituus sp. TaxID=2030822 RepID=UPI0035115846